MADREVPSRAGANEDSHGHPRAHPAGPSLPVILAPRVHEAVAVAAVPSAARRYVLPPVVGDSVAAVVASLWYDRGHARMVREMGERVPVNGGATPPAAAVVRTFVFHAALQARYASGLSLLSRAGCEVKFTTPCRSLSWDPSTSARSPGVFGRSTCRRVTAALLRVRRFRVCWWGRVTTVGCGSPVDRRGAVRRFFVCDYTPLILSLSSPPGEPCSSRLPVGRRLVQRAPCPAQFPRPVGPFGLVART